eukprot:SAG25_NODE_101_length_15508_cov_11.653384_7_plen_633_part_00
MLALSSLHSSLVMLLVLVLLQLCPHNGEAVYGPPPCSGDERPFSGVGFNASACGRYPCEGVGDCPEPLPPVTARPTCTSGFCVLACGSLVGGDCASAAQCYDLGGVGVGVCLFPNSRGGAGEGNSSAPAPTPPMKWWVESSLSRVMPHSIGPAGGGRAAAAAASTATLFLAANERESFQLALRSATNRSFTVQITPPPHSKGLSLSWETVGLVWVPEIASHRTGKDPEDGGPGWWPDPTFATTAAFGVAGITTSLWFTAHASATTPPGQYSFSVQVTPQHLPSSSSAADGSYGPIPAAITLPVTVTVWDFSLPTQPALLTAFNLGESALAEIYDKNASYAPRASLAAIEAMWNATGCSNPFSSTTGEQGLWTHSEDGGASDMFAYCRLTQAGTATPGQLAVCGSVPGNCTLQHLHSHAEFQPSTRAGHTAFMQWSRWLLSRFSLNPGTIYSPPIPFTVPELKELQELGLNTFTAFKANEAYGQNACIQKYVAELEKEGLLDMATTYGYDESDQLDSMQTTFAALKKAFPKIKTFTTAHMCGAPDDWHKPLIPCYGTCPGPDCRNGTKGIPVQDPVQIMRRNIDYMTPILDWVKPSNMSACEAAGYKMWMYTSLEPWSNYSTTSATQLSGPEF